MQQDAEKPRPGPAPEPAERDDVVVAQRRCPFCHDSVKADPDAWVACGACLGPHHAACWDEAGRCAACGSTTRLAVVDAPAARRTGSRRAMTAAALIAAFVALLVVGTVSLASARRADEVRRTAAEVERAAAAERAADAERAAAERAADAERAVAAERAADAERAVAAERAALERAALERAALERAAPTVPFTLPPGRLEPSVLVTLRSDAGAQQVVPGQEVRLRPGRYVLELERPGEGQWRLDVELVRTDDGRAALHDGAGRDPLRWRPYWSVPDELHAASANARWLIVRGDWSGARPHLERAAQIDPEYCGGGPADRPGVAAGSISELLAECERRLEGR